jgi:23S rRNA pseudouridine2605 synthase
MRINSYIAKATGLGRRTVDKRIQNGAVKVNGALPEIGQSIDQNDIVLLDGKTVRPPATSQTIMLHKPLGYVCSRDGQGSKTIYDLLPKKFQNLKPVGRLDKDSSGLLLLTNDGRLSNQLTHPSFKKQKVYKVALDKPLIKNDLLAISKKGINIGDDRPSSFQLQPIDGAAKQCLATLEEGRNRQIRRTFAALDYKVQRLHRISFGDYRLNKLPTGSYEPIKRLSATEY